MATRDAGLMSALPFSRIVLLGHTGYIGSRLAAAFQASAPDIPLVGRSAPTLDLTKPDSAAALEDLLDPDGAVVVCAAIKKQLGDTPEILAQNLAMTTNICRALAARPVRRIVFFSSASVYGEDVQHGVIDESTAVQPTSFYGIGKFTAERLLLRMVGQKPGASLLMLRPALVYGPHEPAYYYGPSGFLRLASVNSPITLWGDGEELREFLFIDDVVALVTRLTFADTTGVLNIVSGTSYTYGQALGAIATLTGHRPVVASRPRTKEKVDHRFDAARLRQAVPGFTFTPLADGLRRVAAEMAAVPGARS
jgi:UDP-glucose 4-epimerase